MRRAEVFGEDTRSVGVEDQDCVYLCGWCLVSLGGAPVGDVRTEKRERLGAIMVGEMERWRDGCGWRR